ncbi:hypothetical protein BMS3Abin10_00249 [bacterium BMS3Abin10]|nr:hypothetical protein BMS3Abin10_00249 [bacterium BMS3Abin10]GBE38613.1 hypothetical protein BMS3Bbin08_01220 [bacterium BMS3Bbin08]
MGPAFSINPRIFFRKCVYPVKRKPSMRSEVKKSDNIPFPDFESKILLLSKRDYSD